METGRHNVMRRTASIRYFLTAALVTTALLGGSRLFIDADPIATQVGTYDSGTYGAGVYDFGEAPSLAFTIANAASCNGTTATIAPLAGTNIDFGVLGTGVLTTAAQSLTVDTNASGFEIRIQSPSVGFSTSGGSTIPLVSSTYATPAAFPGSGAASGWTTGATDVAGGTATRFNGPPTMWAPFSATAQQMFRKTTGSVLGSPTSTCAAFAVRTAASTAAGSYVAAVTYTAVPTF